MAVKKPAKAEAPATPRQQLLHQAQQITAVDRNKAYGNPEDNFRNIANMWTAYTKAQGHEIEFTPSDVAQMMILMKVARLATNPTHWDSILDVAGYAACSAECAAAAQNNSRSNLSN